MTRALWLLIALATQVGMTAEPDPPMIAVTGVGEIRVAPDRATLQLGVESRQLDLAAARREVTQTVAEFLAFCKKMGIAEKDLATSGLGIQPEYSWNNNVRRLTGYFVARSLVVNLPGRVPPGQVHDDLIAFSDFFPTIVEAVGLPAKDLTDGDGWSFWPQCLGQPGQKRQWIYGYYFPRPYAAKLDNKYSHYEVRYARDKRYKLYGNGDLYVEIRVTVPTDLTDKQREILEAARKDARV